MKDKNGEEVKHGSWITWNVWDNDDFVTHKLFGILYDHTQLTGVFQSNKKFVVYLGGGFDFGMGIGQQLLFDEVEQDADNNDEDDRGVTVLGKAMDFVRLLNETSK